MFNYEKMMKLAKDRDEVADRAKLFKQVENLRAVRQELREKVAKLGGTGVQQQSSSNVKVNTSIALDYVGLCYAL